MVFGRASPGRPIGVLNDKTGPFSFFVKDPKMARLIFLSFLLAAATRRINFGTNYVEMLHKPK